MSELATKQMVLVTRIGDFWLSETRAKAVMEIGNQDKQANINIEGIGWIRASSIEGLLTAEQYGNLQYKRRGMWQCVKQQWHSRDDQCYCTRVPKATKPNVKELTPDEQKKARKKAEQVRKELKEKGIL